MDVFTPLNEDRTIRGRFNAKDITVISGEMGTRKRGKQARIELQGKTYDVIGISCGLPGCNCDAYIKEVKEEIAI